MRLNRSTSHAMRILIACAEAGDELVKVADLSVRLDITQQNVFKIVHILSHAGLIMAQRGRYGGVRLSRAAAQIRIGDVVRAMEATAFEIDNEGPGGTIAADGSRVSGVNRVLDEALEACTSVLDRHSLADLVKPRRRVTATDAAAARAPTRVPARTATKAHGEAPRARR